MNDFDYAIAYQKIESAKLVYELEELVRGYTVRVYQIDKLSLLECINSYKALTLALKSFRDKSKKVLPDFIHDSVMCFEYRITKLVLDHPITYEQFIDCFQFKSGIIKCDLQYNAGYAILKSFALIVGSNPQPYTFDWSYSSNLTYRELISGWTFKIIELEHFKQQNQLVSNTIVEHELTKLYSKVNPDPIQVANAHDFVKQIDQVYDTIKSKLI
mgnify:CR=1 FL=1